MTLERERRLRRWTWLGIAAVLTFAFFSMGLALVRERTVPFSKELWRQGANDTSKQNPRRRMAREAESMIEQGMTRERVEELLGPRDRKVVVKLNDGTELDASPYQPSLIYVLGRHPRRAFRLPSLEFLVVMFDKKGRKVEHVFRDEAALYPGAQIRVVPPNASKRP